MASRKTATRKAKAPAKKPAKKRVRKAAPSSRGSGKTSAQEDHIRKLIAGGHVKVVKVASFEQDLDAIRRGVEPSRTLRYIDVPADKYDEFLANGGTLHAANGHSAGPARPFTLVEDSPKLTDREFSVRITDSDGNWTDFDIPAGEDALRCFDEQVRGLARFPPLNKPEAGCDDMRRRFEEDCNRMKDAAGVPERLHGAGVHRYGVGDNGPVKPLGAMAQKPSRPGVRGQLDATVRLTAQIGEALDGLAAVLDPVLGGPTPMAEAENMPMFDSSLQQEVAEHNERLEALLSRVRSLVDRVRV